MTAQDDLKHLMRQNFLEYASYVILDRAIPNVVDGLKPVQRRILHTLQEMDDGKLHKVANVAGQTMAYHPHGDAAIIDALVNIANKDYLLDRQGNFGNLYTGDPAAAARYIETRLSPLARETMFNPQLTSYLPSYDGRRNEPTTLPAKLPVVLMHGAEGIAVGMATRILPHNFCELLEAEIAILQNKPFKVLPDFPTGGIMDASDYKKGRGKVKLRAKIVEQDDKTLVIEEICYGTTTESVIRSIDEAAKRGKLKIDAIHDYTADKVAIEIKLPRGQHASELLEVLYHFTDCEVSINSQLLVIKDQLPWEADVDEVLRLHSELLKGYLKTELELARDHLEEEIFNRTLEQIFIEERLYKKIEQKTSYQAIHETIATSLEPFHKDLARDPTKEDRERLLNIPIRRISRFDIEKNQKDIERAFEKLEEIEKHLGSINRFTINYLKGLLKQYGKSFPRRTEIQEIEAIDRRKVRTRQVRVFIDAKRGFVGTNVKGDTSLECTNFDKLLLLFKDGSFKVINVAEKQFVLQEKQPLVYVGVADKKTLFSVVYRDPKTNYAYGKRFVVSSFMLDKLYSYLPEGTVLEFLSTAESPRIEVTFRPKARQKTKRQTFSLDEIAKKGVKAKGTRLASRAISKVRVPKNGHEKDEQLSFF